MHGELTILQQTIARLAGLEHNPEMLICNDLVNEIDGFRMTFANGYIVHLRPSGNAPELRCYVESDSEQTSQNLVKSVLDAILNAF